MTTVTENVDLPTGADPSRGVATIRLYGEDGVALDEAYDTVAGKTIVGKHEITLDGTTTESPSPGSWSLADKLPPNVNLLPAGTAWGRIVTGPRIDSGRPSYGIVPATGTKRWDEILTEAPASVASAALELHAADTDLHGGGQELAVASKADADFLTTSTTGADVPGCSITFVVPNRPYVVEILAACTIEEATRWGALLLTDGSGNSVGAPAATYKKEAAGFLGAANYYTKVRVPNPLHAPAVGSTVTYKMWAQTEVATSDFTVKITLFGPVNVAMISAYTQ